MRPSREIHLRSRPVGLPQISDFELKSVEVPAPAPGEVLVKNIVMSVDPYMRGRMIDRKSYVPPFQLGAVLQGAAVGEVLASNSDAFGVGDYVLSMNGWREYFVSGATGLQKVDGDLAPLSAYPAQPARSALRFARSPNLRAAGSWGPPDPKKNWTG
jgi:NADPH-dependent curcumin reductase CurA